MLSETAIRFSFPGPSHYPWPVKKRLVEFVRNEKLKNVRTNHIDQGGRSPGLRVCPWGREEGDVGGGARRLSEGRWTQGRGWCGWEGSGHGAG